MKTSREIKQKHVWKHFTLLDLLLLFPGYALGFALVRWMEVSSQQSVQVPQPWPADAMLIELLLAGFCLGSVFVGPIVLGSHYVWRGRRTRMSMGEWLWLAPGGAYLCFGGIANLWPVMFGHPIPIWFMLLVLTQFVASLVAGQLLFMRLVGYRENATCLWTDCFGCVACILAGVLMAYTLIVDPLYI